MKPKLLPIILPVSPGIGTEISRPVYRTPSVRGLFAIFVAGSVCLFAPGKAIAQLVSFTSASLGAGNTAGASVSATTLGTGMISGVVTRGSGVGVGTGTSRFNSTSFNVTSAALAISGSKFFSITVAPAANYSYSLTGLGVTLGSSGTGPNNWGVYAGAPGFTASTQLSTGSWTAGGTTAVTPTLGSGFTGLTAATEIRVYAWGASASGGTFGPGNSQPLNLNGTATLRSAGTLTWDGGQGANWNTYTATAANQSSWNANNIPATGLADSISFAGSTQTTTTNNIASLTVDDITFASGAGAFTNSGTAVTMNGDVTNSSSNTQTINHGLILSTGSHIVTSSTGSIAIGGAITGAGSINKQGSSQLTLTGANTHTGGTTVTGGTLMVGSATALQNATGTVTVNGGTLSSAVAAVTLGSNLTLTTGAFDPAGAGAGAFVLASNKSFLMDGGTWNLDILSPSSFDKITGSGTGTFTINGGVLDLSGTTLAVGSYQILNGFAAGSGSFTSITGYDPDTFNVFFDTTSPGIGTLNITAIPEPREYAVAIAGMLAVLLVARNRRRRATGG